MEQQDTKMSMDIGNEVLSAVQVGTQENFNDAIFELIKLEGSVIEGYRVAIKYIEDTKHKETLNLFLEQHQQHLNNLLALAKKHEIPCIDSEEEFEKIFYAKMQVLIGELIIEEGDIPILQMLLNNEKDTNAAYERLVKHVKAWPDSMDFLQAAFKDEKNHFMQLVKMLS